MERRKREGEGKRGGKGKERQWKKGKWKIERKRREIAKGEEDLLKWNGERYMKTFFFFFFFACHFLKALKFVRRVPKWKFLPKKQNKTKAKKKQNKTKQKTKEKKKKKKTFHAGEKSGNVTLLPLKDIALCETLINFN